MELHHTCHLIAMAFVTYIFVTNCSALYIRTKHESLTDRLLSMWTMGNARDYNESKEIGKSPDDSLKNVLAFLTSKASASHNGKIPNEATMGLNNLLLQNAKTPKPIDLHNHSPMEAVLKYFNDMDITSNACRLSTICELLTEPQASYGVFGELVSFVFGKEEPDPSVLGQFDARVYKEYYQAAQDGRHMRDCTTLYKNCSSLTKEYIKLINL